MPRSIFSQHPQRRADQAVLEMLVIRVDAVVNVQSIGNPNG
jgi:hypothetical protein